ncbi:MAG: 50S ribosomal protein L11 methyltransferase [Halieaceae bacterium]|nr:50S ribosomal protein L11 methyltransferase [Halieaceae bacterium]
MAWLQVRLNTRADLAPAAENLLLELGAVSVTLQDNADQPLFAGAEPEEKLWQETRVSGLFPADTDLAQLRADLPEPYRGAVQVEILEDKDWEREWMQHYQPRQFADGLWLCPSWLTPPDPDAVNIMLDPGLAFGTGTHPTTAMCLGEIAARLNPGARVVDFGCGSGVLGIAALLLGAADLLATDTDPQALAATWANAERNQVGAGSLTVCHPDKLVGDEQADLVVANILAGPLCELAPVLTAMLTPGATLLLSGILREQVDMVRSAYSLDLGIAREEDGWVALVGRFEEVSTA